MARESAALSLGGSSKNPMTAAICQSRLHGQDEPQYKGY